MLTTYLLIFFRYFKFPQEIYPFKKMYIFHKMNKENGIVFKKIEHICHNKN